MDKRIRTMAIDDEPGALRAISGLIRNSSKELDLIGTADSVESAYALICELKPDLIFLDIQLKKETGFDLLDMSYDFDFEVIFATAYDEFALKAFKAQALSYLLKPVDIDDFNKAVLRAISVIKSDPFDSKNDLVVRLQKKYRDRIPVHIGTETEYINPSDILFIKASGSYSELYLDDGTKRLVSKNTKHFELALSEQGFLRPHRSYLVNISKICKISRTDGGFAELSNGVSIPTTRDGRDLLERVMG